MAAVSSNDVWAVGDHGGLTRKPLVEHWDGTQWSVVKSPNPHGYSGLNGVAASGKGTIWAVGYYTNGSGLLQTLIERGQGNTWKIVASPNPGGGDDLLGGVSAVPGSHTVWAVGWTDGPTLIERWNGSTWKAVSSPSPGTYNVLVAVAASSAHNVWAVGHYNPSGQPGQTLTESYC